MHLWLLCLRTQYNGLYLSYTDTLCACNWSTFCQRHQLHCHIQKYSFLAQQIGWLHRPGFSGFPTSKQEVSVEKKHHTRATIAAPKHEKSLFIFDRLPTFNGRVYVLQKQTERLGGRRLPAPVALVVSWITGHGGAVAQMAHTELLSDSATLNWALLLFSSSVVNTTFPDVRAVASILASPHCWFT